MVSSLQRIVVSRFLINLRRASRHGSTAEPSFSHFSTAPNIPTATFAQIIGNIDQFVEHEAERAEHGDEVPPSGL